METRVRCLSRAHQFCTNGPQMVLGAVLILRQSPILFWYRSNHFLLSPYWTIWKNLWPMEYFRTPNVLLAVSALITTWQFCNLSQLPINDKGREILTIKVILQVYSHHFCFEFPWFIRQKVNLCSIIEPLSLTQGFFLVSLFLIWVLIRQERSQPSCRDKLEF